MKAILAVLSFVLWSAAPARGSAHAAFQADYSDPPGAGFFDTTPREPSGGNSGTTLGEQRRLAFERALEIWSRALASEVVIRVEATFDPFPALPCSADAAVLGAAASVSAFAGFPGATRSDVFYPSPLADKLATRDLDPGEADLTALFNPRLDASDCLGGLGWDYGFQGALGRAHFINTVLHELTHGLGFASLVDTVTGAAPEGVSIFETLMFDRTMGSTWDLLTPPERAQSAMSPGALVWIGEAVTAAASNELAWGRPRLAVDGVVIDWVSEPSFGPFVSEAPVEGPLLAPDLGDDCRGDVRGAIVLVDLRGSCRDIERALAQAADDGARAVLFRSAYEGLPPWPVDATISAAELPSLSVFQTDFDRLVGLSLSDAEPRARLDVEDRLLGVDDDGRVLLSANDPVLSGTSASHWDGSVRALRSTADEPIALLMEPAVTGVPGTRISDLSVQLLQDIGWDDVVCGNDWVEPGEECDRGIDNDDQAADACRTTCRLPFCGDGVADTDEVCDGSEGCKPDCRVNSDAGPDAGTDPGSGLIDATAPAGHGTGRDAASNASKDSGVAEASRSASSFGRERGCACRVFREHGGSGHVALVGMLALTLFGRRLFRVDKDVLRRRDSTAPSYLSSGSDSDSPPLGPRGPFAFRPLRSSMPPNGSTTSSFEKVSR